MAEEIYQVADRIKNLARETGGALTPHGTALCNTYAFVLLDFYNFAKKLPPELRDELNALIRSNENLPKKVIALINPEPDYEEDPFGGPFSST